MRIDISPKCEELVAAIDGQLNSARYKSKERFNKDNKTDRLVLFVDFYGEHEPRMKEKGIFN